MCELNTERMPPKKEVSGIWVLLIFVILLAAVVTVATVVMP